MVMRCAHGLAVCNCWQIDFPFEQILLAWSAMYLKHHYLTDVLGGWAYAYLAMKIADWGRPKR